MDGRPDIDVDHLARLAHLDLSPEERDHFARQLAEILGYVAQIQQVDTTDVPATARVMTAEAGLRPDRRQPGLDRGRVLTGAPDADSVTGLFKVPRVIGG